MPALGSADVAVTVNERWQTQRKRQSKCTVVFGDGAKTYPTGGVPLPAFGKFGLQRTLDYVRIIDGANASGIFWKYDATNKTFRGYQSAGFTPAGSIAVTEGAVTVKGGGGGEAMTLNPDSTAGVLTKAAATDRVIPRATLGFAASTAALTGTAVAAGSLVELTTAVTPAAQTLVVEAQGW